MDAFFKLPTFEELWWLNELPQWLSNKKFTCKCRRHRFHPWIKKIPWRRKWQPTLVFLPKKTPWTEVWRAAVCEVTKSGARLSTHTMTEWRQTWSSEPDIFLFLCLLFCDLELHIHEIMKFVPFYIWILLLINVFVAWSIFLLVALVFGFAFLIVPCSMRILVPQSGIKPMPLQWKRKFLTTGPPQKSLVFFVFCFFLNKIY